MLDIQFKQILARNLSFMVLTAGFAYAFSLLSGINSVYWMNKYLYNTSYSPWITYSVIFAVISGIFFSTGTVILVILVVKSQQELP